MSEIQIFTRCPHCETTFRVYEHQLERRAGQVRCGACGSVFDAYIDLETKVDAQLTAGTPAVPAAPVAPTASPPPSKPARMAPIVARDDLDFTGPAPNPDPFVEEEPIDEAYDFGPRALDRSADRRQIALIALLGFVLALQSAIWFRGELAGYFPSTRPALNAICAVAGCAVNLPRNADRIAIETSELQAERPGLLVLVGTLRNNANYAQAYPSVELTLTDGRDQPIVRRVLVPRDYLEPGLAALDGVAAGGEIPLRAVIDASKISASGYRMFIFYPTGS